MGAIVQRVERASSIVTVSLLKSDILEILHPALQKRFLVLANNFLPAKAA